MVVVYVGSVDYADIDELADDESVEEKERLYQKGMMLLQKTDNTGGTC